MVKAQTKECWTFGGAIFLCNHLTRKECFEKKIFGLSPYCADFVEKVKAGTTLFLFDVDQRKLHGVFEATSDGAVNIIPDAYASIGRQYPSQIRFKRIWFCKPLMEGEFEDAVQKTFATKNKFSYGLSHQQVTKLLHLFSSRNRLQLQNSRLQPPQNPRLQDDLSREFEISSLVKETDMQSSPNSGSCGSFRSPSQTCSSSTLGEHAASLGHKLIDHLSLVNRVLQSDISNVTKSNSSKSSLHTGVDAAIVTTPRTQEATDDQSTDDYIPLPQEDPLEGVDDLFWLLEDEIHSSETKGRGDAEDHTAFHQACVRKEDGCYPSMVNSKLQSDNEGRKSVFSRLARTHETFSQRQCSKSQAFPPKSADSSNPLSQKKKQWRAQHKKQFPCHNDGMLDIPSAGRLREVPALDYSFVWSDNRRSTRFSGVHECNEVSVKEEMRKPTLTFKQRANDSNFEGGDQRFDSEDMEEARGKKRPVTASFHHNANTMDSSQQSFGDRKTLSNDETGSHVAADHLGTETFFQEKQNRSVRSCHGVVNGDKTLLLGKFGTMDFLPNDDEGCGNKRSLPSDVSDRLVASSETEMPLLQKQTPNVQSCSEVVRDDKVLVPKISELEFPKFDADCGNKGTSLGSDYRDGSSEHKYSKTRDADCDTSSVLEYSTVDTSTGDRGSEHENSFGEKGEVLYSVTGSKDHRNTTNSLSSDGSRSCAATDQECSKVVLLLEEQYQNFQSRLELAHENSNSVDSFAVSAEGCRSKSGMSTYTATGHQVSDLLGMNSESRTSFINDSSNGSAETFSTSAQGGEHVGPNTNGLEVYAEPPILQHDPGEAMELR